MVPITSHVNQACCNRSSLLLKYLYPYKVLVPFLLKKIKPFSLELDINSKSLSNNLLTILVWSTTIGSPSLSILATSQNLEYLPALSKNPIVVPNEIGLVLLLKL